ncbi:hypothetical protein TrLO_g6486 [Triparma laevis f. longispina]|uniref:DNA-directed RNA polymerase III subunit RPC9 n=1 Tax=Triparma laevis f. longispina TaxID=1714387 RepID=A0A9W7CL59_9STRA|nr:hypothetical protein TrLO_g6486 [Triparma laevis f. longispina]
MEILSSPQQPDLLTNHEVMTLLTSNLAPPKSKKKPVSKKNQPNTKSPPPSAFQTSALTYLTSLPPPLSPLSLLRTLSSPKYSLEKTEIIQLVNLLPDNLPLLNVVLPEVEERFEEGVGEEILEVVKIARGKEK